MKRVFLLSAVLVALSLLWWAGAIHAGPCEYNIPPRNPNIVYTDHGNGTVTDTRTGLMWKQCAEGLSGASCQTGSAQTFTWANALAHAEASSFANYSDWRLPNVKELSSLVEDCRERPAINTHFFPNTVDGGSGFWSGSPHAHADGSGRAWLLMFSNGGVYNDHRTNSHRVRLVRSSQ